MLHVVPAGIASFPSGYVIQKALLFNGSNDSLNRTPSSSAASSARIFTMSVWLKRSEITDPTYDGYLFCCSPDEDGIAITQDDDKLAFRIEGSTYVMTALNVYRDPTAWFHLVLRIDSTQAVAANRIRIYINGTQLTLSGTPPDQNYDYTRWLVDAKIQRVGWNGNTTKYYDGYMAEFRMYDGTSLGPDSFGETSEDTGVWLPIKPPSSGFGNNGFALEFKETGTSQNSSGIGADTSGNNNHFAVANLVAASQVEDSPSNDANNNIGNYPTIGNWRRSTNPHAVSGGNLIGTGTDDPGTVQSSVCTQAISSGKFYWEVTLVSGSISSRIGIAVIGSRTATAPTDSIYVGNHAVDDTNWALNAWASGTHKGKIGHSASSSVAQANYANNTTFAAGDVIGVALDMDNGALWFANDGTYLGADLSASNAATIAEVAAGTVTNAAVGPNANCAVNFNLSSSVVVPIFTTDGVTAVTSINFGQKAFAQTIPSGFKRLMSANMTQPTFKKGAAFYKSLIWTGNGDAVVAAGNTSRALTGLGFLPDFVWIKSRSSTADHVLADSVRGGSDVQGTDIAIMPNLVNSQGSGVDGGHVKTFDSDGFTVRRGDGGQSGFAAVNRTDNLYVAFCLRAGGAPTTDNDNTSGAMDDGSVFKSGSVQSSFTPSGSPSIYPKKMTIAEHGGFSIIEYTGNGSAGATIPHGLSAAADFQIFKRTNSNQDWHVGTNVTGSIIGIELNNNTSTVTAAVSAFNTNTTALAASGVVNDNTDTYISYAFARTAGVIAVGSYVGNGNVKGPAVIVNDGAFGFKPAWLMVKRISNNDDWKISNNGMSPFNPVLTDSNLNANTSAADDTPSGPIDYMSNGFKLNLSNGPWNADGDSYIYLAFAETSVPLNNRAR